MSGYTPTLTDRLRREQEMPAGECGLESQMEKLGNFLELVVKVAQIMMLKSLQCNMLWMIYKKSLRTTH